MKFYCRVCVKNIHRISYMLHLPSNISIVIALDTISRDARSFAFGAYRSMKNSPSELSSFPPSPRLPSVIKMPLPYIPGGKIDWLNGESFCPRGLYFPFCYANTGWMKLDELHIFKRQSCSGGHRHTISGAYMCRGAGQVTSSCSSCS